MFIIIIFIPITWVAWMSMRMEWEDRGLSYVQQLARILIKTDTSKNAMVGGMGFIEFRTFFPTKQFFCEELVLIQKNYNLRLFLQLLNSL